MFCNLQFAALHSLLTINSLDQEIQCLTTSNWITVQNIFWPTELVFWMFVSHEGLVYVSDTRHDHVVSCNIEFRDIVTTCFHFSFRSEDSCSRSLFLTTDLSMYLPEMWSRPIVVIYVVSSHNLQSCLRCTRWKIYRKILKKVERKPAYWHLGHQVKLSLQFTVLVVTCTVLEVQLEPSTVLVFCIV